MDEYLLEIMAQRHEEELEGRINDQRSHNSLKPTRGAGEFLAEECGDCGEPLPLFRKQCGLITCVPCQEIKDKLRVRNGR